MISPAIVTRGRLSLETEGKTMNDKSFANGNGPAVHSNNPQSSGWDIRPESHWNLTIGVLPS